MQRYIKKFVFAYQVYHKILAIEERLVAKHSNAN